MSQNKADEWEQLKDEDLDQIEKLVALQCRFKLLRQTLDLEQAELGDLIGVSRQTINNIENLRSPLSPTQYVALAAYVENKVKEQPSLGNVIEAIVRMDIAEETLNKLKQIPSMNMEKIVKMITKRRAKAAAVGAAVGSVVGGIVSPAFVFSKALADVGKNLFTDWIDSKKKSKKKK